MIGRRQKTMPLNRPLETFAVGHNVLVTGGAGYVGSHACKALAAAGHVPVTIDNFIQGDRAAVKWGPLVEGDTGDQALLRRAIHAHGITAVMHFAAHAYVGESMQVPGKYFHNNVAKSLALLDVVRACGIDALVFSSSCATYGVPQRVPIDETHPQAPVNPYGESKLFVEKALRWYGGAHGLRSVALRYFNAAGADAAGEIGEQHDPETHLIPLAIAAALGQRPTIDVYGTDYPTPDGTAIRDYIHVTDLAAAHVLALEYLLAGGASAALNLGTGRGCSVVDVLETVANVSGRRVVRRNRPRRPGDPACLVADPTRARAVLGWAPTLSDLPTIVGSALRWHMRESRGSAVDDARGVG
jgi:UDP-glucose-4-epimerase GalE